MSRGDTTHVFFLLELAGLSSEGHFESVGCLSESLGNHDPGNVEEGPQAPPPVIPYPLRLEKVIYYLWVPPALPDVRAFFPLP